MKIKYNTRELAKKLFPYIYYFVYVDDMVRVLFNEKYVQNVRGTIEYIEQSMDKSIHGIILETCNCDTILVLPNKKIFYRIDISNSKFNTHERFVSSYSIAHKGKANIKSIVRPLSTVIYMSNNVCKKDYIKCYDLIPYMKNNMSNITLNYMNMICL